MAESAKEEKLLIQPDAVCGTREEMRRELTLYLQMFVMSLSGISAAALMSGARHWDKFLEVYFCPPGGCFEESNPCLYTTLVVIPVGVCVCSLATMIWRGRRYRSLNPDNPLSLVTWSFHGRRLPPRRSSPYFFSRCT